MAKLDGVKTLDMVNGEITKVEYDGAVYTKVEDNAKKNDLIMATKDGVDTDLGSFYKIDHQYAGRPSYYDDVDDSCTASRIPNAAFRKVEEPLKVGDYVKVITDDDIRSEVQFGQIRRLIEIDGSTVPYYAETLDSLYKNWFNATKLVRATEEEIAEITKPKTKFKVGDYVKAVKSNSGHVGKVFVVTKVFSEPEMYNGITYTFEATPIDDRDIRTAYSNDDRSVLATEEEIAAAKTEVKWAKIGRHLNEFKVGDIIHVDATSAFGVNTFGEVVREADEDGDLRVEAVDDAGDEEEFFVPTEKATLVTPVEARFDR